MGMGITLGGCARPDLEDKRREAYRLYQDKEYAAAAQEFEVLVEHIPRDAELWFRLGNAYTRSMQPKRAISAYENAILRDPRLTRAWYNKGVVHLQQGLKTFVDMHEYVDSADPVARQGELKRDQLLDLLSPSNAVD
jgi:tetratricopeptide (TPR) repeat protein